MLKKTFTFLLILLPWFLSSLLPIDYNYYKTIKLPFFAPNNMFYIIAWTITYISISISIYQILKENGLKKINKSYKITLLINYLANQSFQLVFFIIKNNFLGFISCITTFLSTLFLIEETNNIRKKSTKFLYPYILLSLFATILSLSIYLLNI